MGNRKIEKAVILIAIGDILITVISILAVLYFKHNAPFSIGAILLGMYTFFGFFLLGLKLEQEVRIGPDILRTAITASIIIVYFYLVGLTAFFKSWPDEIPTLSQTFISNFTTIVGVVIAFYFTSSVINTKIKSDSQKKETMTK